MAADIGSLQRLPKLAGNDSLVRELALTGRFFDASTADRLGLVSRVVDGGRAEVQRAAMEVAREIAALSPVATVGTKHLREPPAPALPDDVGPSLTHCSCLSLQSTVRPLPVDARCSRPLTGRSSSLPARRRARPHGRRGPGLHRALECSHAPDGRHGARRPCVQGQGGRAAALRPAAGRLEALREASRGVTAEDEDDELGLTLAATAARRDGPSRIVSCQLAARSLLARCWRRRRPSRHRHAEAGRQGARALPEWR